LSGQIDMAKESIKKYLVLHPEKKDQVIKDRDLISIRHFLSVLQT